MPDAKNKSDRIIPICLIDAADTGRLYLDRNTPLEHYFTRSDF